MSLKTFIISFFDGLSNAGVLGDLRIPGTPDRLFEPEPDDLEMVENTSELDGHAKLDVSADRSKNIESV